jgi:hypothetical protein
MSWTQLKISPGLVRNTTRYAASGTWFDCSLVRFRDGAPEKWAGWEDDFPGFRMVGKCRSLLRHADLAGFSWLSAGTSQRFYMLSEDFRYDVTPYSGLAITLPNNPISTTAGSNVIRVHAPSHNHFTGDVVAISGATAVGGLSDTVINGGHGIISSDVDGDNYYTVISAGGVEATSTATGGGAVVKAHYLLRAGTDDVINRSTARWTSWASGHRTIGVRT